MRRKAIPHSDSPWGQQYSGRGLSASSRGSGPSNPNRNDGWLIGPTWLYVAAAVVIFAVAAAVAVVQATGSDDAVGPQPDQAAAAAAEQGESELSAGQGDERDEPAAAQPQQSADPEQPTEQQVAAEESQQREAETPDESDALQQQDAQQDTQQQSPGSSELSNPLRGFIIPIQGACISEHEGHLPASRRAYRNDGIHEGLDFYQWAACTTIGYTTEILAAKAGVVIRADLNYVDITPADWDRFDAANWEGDEILNELRGRQVYIDHGRGIVTRYAHLSAIAAGITIGVEVQQGQVIGYPGESGQQEVYADPGADIHLHFEIRIADGWLGQGETPQEARRLYLQAFGLAGE